MNAGKGEGMIIYLNFNPGIKLGINDFSPTGTQGNYFLIPSFSINWR